MDGIGHGAAGLEGGHADADRDRDGVRSAGDGLLGDGEADGFGDGGGDWPGSFRENQRHFLTAIAGGEDPWTGGGLEDLSNFGQDLIAGLMSESVVDRLEFIHVDHEKGERPAAAFAAANCCLRDSSKAARLFRPVRASMVAFCWRTCVLLLQLGGLHLGLKRELDEGLVGFLEDRLVVCGHRRCSSRRARTTSLVLPAISSRSLSQSASDILIGGGAGARTWTIAPAGSASTKTSAHRPAIWTSWAIFFNVGIGDLRGVVAGADGGHQDRRKLPLFGEDRADLGVGHAQGFLLAP